MTHAQKINIALSRVPTWPVYVLGALPPLWFLYLGLTGGLGAEPIRALELELGGLTIKMVIVVLAVTPLRNWTGVNLVKFRRSFGLLIFYFVICHLLVWLVLDVQVPERIWADILKRPYITIGMFAFTLMIPLAITSNNWSIRKLGPKGWRRLHQLTYCVAVLGSIHFVMVRKGLQIEPLIYLGGAIGLLLMRVNWRKLSGRFTSALGGA